MSEVLVLLGAEGCAEADPAWVREPTTAEIEAHRFVLGDQVYDRALRDGTGRPYFPMVVTNAAPQNIRNLAARYKRMVRLEE